MAFMPEEEMEKVPDRADTQTDGTAHMGNEE